MHSVGCSSYRAEQIYMEATIKNLTKGAYKPCCCHHGEMDMTLNDFVWELIFLYFVLIFYEISHNEQQEPAHYFIGLF